MIFPFCTGCLYLFMTCNTGCSNTYITHTGCSNIFVTSCQSVILWISNRLLFCYVPLLGSWAECQIFCPKYWLFINLIVLLFSIAIVSTWRSIVLVFKCDQMLLCIRNRADPISVSGSKTCFVKHGCCKILLNVKNKVLLHAFNSVLIEFRNS